MGPAPGARDQVARLLTLVPFLHHRDGVRLAEAAELLGSSPGEVLSDLKVLFMCGLPGGLPDDLIDVDLDSIESRDGNPVADGVIRVENADYLSRPLRLSPTEASALIVALQTLREATTPETAAIVDRVLGKLGDAVAHGPSARNVALVDGAREADHALLAGRLEAAVSRRRQVRLTYFVPSRDEVSERVVDPLGLVRHGIFTYLDAWCHTAGAARLFRIDRITEATVLDSPVTTVADGPRDLGDGPFREETAGRPVTVRLAAPARWAVDYYPVLAVREVGDGAVEADLVVADERWLIRLMLRLAPYAEVVAPEEFTQSFHAAARDALALYG